MEGRGGGRLALFSLSSALGPFLFRTSFESAPQEDLQVASREPPALQAGVPGQAITRCSRWEPPCSPTEARRGWDSLSSHHPPRPALSWVALQSWPWTEVPVPLTVGWEALRPPGSLPPGP